MFQTNYINIFKLTGSMVIGLKFSGKLGSLFLRIKMVAALVLCAGKVLLVSTSVQIFNMNSLKYGHHLEQIIDIWSNEHGKPEDFMPLIISVISW